MIQIQNTKFKCSKRFTISIPKYSNDLCLEFSGFPLDGPGERKVHVTLIGNKEKEQEMSRELPPFSEPAQSLRPGRYRHHSGKEYEVMEVARHSETLEELVVYRASYGGGELWVRPLDMFVETVEKDGVYQPRFEHIEEEQNE